MTIKEMVRSAKDFIVGEQPKRLPEHYGFRAQDADPDLMAALLAADYRHLPEIDVNLK